MIIVKGIALGLIMFAAFSILYLRAWGMLGSKAVGLEAMNAVVVHNYLFWTVGVLMMVLGCVIMVIWPVRVR